MTNVTRLLAAFFLFNLFFFSACTKEDSRDNTEALTQQRLEEASKNLGPASYKLEPGVQIVAEGTEGESLVLGTDDRTNQCVATINVDLGPGSTLLANNVGTFTGPLNVTFNINIGNGQSYLVAYGGTTGVTITQLNTGGCVVFSVAPSAKYKVVSSTFQLFCAENLCLINKAENPWLLFS